MCDLAAKKKLTNALTPAIQNEFGGALVKGYAQFADGVLVVSRVEKLVMGPA